MNKNPVAHEQQRTIGATLAVLVTAVALAGTLSSHTVADDAAPIAAAAAVPTVEGTPADLEQAFWICDYAGTMGGVDPATAVACVTVTEAFKNARFEGDFDAMLAWWRQHKPAAHKAVEAARAGASSADWTALPRL